MRTASILCRALRGTLGALARLLLLERGFGSLASRMRGSLGLIARVGSCIYHKIVYLLIDGDAKCICRCGTCGADPRAHAIAIHLLVEQLNRIANQLGWTPANGISLLSSAWETFLLSTQRRSLIQRCCSVRGGVWLGYDSRTHHCGALGDYDICRQQTWTHPILRGSRWTSNSIVILLLFLFHLSCCVLLAVDYSLNMKVLRRFLRVLLLFRYWF